MGQMSEPLAEQKSVPQNTGQVEKPLSPADLVRAAETKYMAIHSKFVNQFNPSEIDGKALDTASAELKTLYEKYPDEDPTKKTQNGKT